MATKTTKPSKPTKYKDLLDYTISYKTVWTTIGLVFAFGVAGLIAWGRMKPASADELARQEVKAAERLLVRAQGCAQQDLKPDDQRLLTEGQEAITAAQVAIGNRRFGEATASANDAQESLKKFVDTVCATRDAVAEFVRIQGDVKVKKVQSPRWVPARKGQLAVGDRVWAIDGVAQIAYKLSGDLQEIRPGTIIEIKDVFQRADGSSGTEVSLEKGEMSMRSAANSPSIIRAPNLTVEPGGDQVEIESQEGSGVTRATSRRGGAKVTQGDRSVTLERGTRVESTTGGMLGQPSKALDPPELKEPIDGRIFSSEKPEDKLIAFKWVPVDGVQGYVFQIARNDVFAPVLNSGEMERVAAAIVELDAPPPNTYYWRAAAVDRAGIRGDWSEVRRFSVRGNLPVGKGPPPPSIEITNKVNFGDRVIVSGTTQQYVTLEVMLNGRRYQDVNVDEQGRFQVLVTLSQEGKNSIEFVAHDTYGQETKKQVSAYFTL